MNLILLKELKNVKLNMTISKKLLVIKKQNYKKKDEFIVILNVIQMLKKNESVLRKVK